MLTTVGICDFAMLLNVDASIGPLSGAVFAVGTLTVWAEDVGERSRRDAITIPTATDARAIRTA
jgi:hypothetical protein